MNLASWSPVRAEPDFNNLLRVLRREQPTRPTLFELFLNEPLFRFLVGAEADRIAARRPYGDKLLGMTAFRNAGYDYYTVRVPGLQFPSGAHDQKATISQNEGVMIRDRASFDAYPWPDPAVADYTVLDVLAREMPCGMKMVACGPGGVLENVTGLLGYENLCYLIADDEKLTADVFDAVGSRLLAFYERVVQHDAVGAIISNDDWGFKSQPLLPPDSLRRFVFPWHRRIVAAAHRAGKPAILHSCGNLASLMDEIIDDLGFDAKHSYEDSILPVEQAYAQYGSRIAIVGGIDVDFVCRATPEQLYQRSRAMLTLSNSRGYALGTGNSVPQYVPTENYLAMIRAATEGR